MAAPNPPTFAPGQAVRLTAVYHGKPFSMYSVPTANVCPRKTSLVTTALPAGTRFTVHNRQKAPAERLDGPTVLVRNEAGTWCIPVRLLEAVPAVEQAQEPQIKETARDREGERVG